MYCSVFFFEYANRTAVTVNEERYKPVTELEEIGTGNCGLQQARDTSHRTNQNCEIFWTKLPGHVTVIYSSHLDRSI